MMLTLAHYPCARCECGTQRFSHRGGKAPSCQFGDSSGEATTRRDLTRLRVSGWRVRLEHPAQCLARSVVELGGDELQGVGVVAGEVSALGDVISLRGFKSPSLRQMLGAFEAARLPDHPQPAQLNVHLSGGAGRCLTAGGGVSRQTSGFSRTPVISSPTPTLPERFFGAPAEYKQRLSSSTQPSQFGARQETRFRLCRGIGAPV